MYTQREKPKEKKKQVTVVVNQTKTLPRLGEDYLAHHSNRLGQRQDKAQISHTAARYCQPSPSTIQRMDDNKDKDKDKEQSSENLDNLQLSLELLGMTPGVGMIADAANVGISLFRGNYADALINLAAMVPIVGQGVSSGKLAAKAASSARDTFAVTKQTTASLTKEVGDKLPSSVKGTKRIFKSGNEIAPDNTNAMGKGLVPNKIEASVSTYKTPYNPLSKPQRTDLKTKLDARTISKDEYQHLEWDRRFANRRATGVRKFWAEERARLRANQSGTRNWDREQREAILSGGRPKHNGETVQGHHKYNALDHPQIANDPENIYPATKTEHFERWHGGNWKNDTFGDPLRPLYLEEF